MAGRVIWSDRAKREKKSIFAYWNEHNQSKAYSRKLNNLFKEAIKFLKEHPNAGKKTAISNVSIQIVRDYLIAYETKSDCIIILTIWDGRRNPDSLGIPNNNP